jgi:hypothetical protein
MWMALMPWAAPPAQAPPVSVEVVVKKPLGLVQHMVDKVKGPVELVGELEVRVKNTGKEVVILADLQHHGLLLRGAAGAEHQLVHPCLCVEQAQNGVAQKAVAPGETLIVALDGFGCGGGPFKPPAAGRWEVVYRVLPWADTPRDTKTSPPDQTQKCRARLADPATWASAVASRPIAVVLKPPRLVRH